jgi:hypothetical protein
LKIGVGGADGNKKNRPRKLIVYELLPGVYSRYYKYFGAVFALSSGIIGTALSANE